jgi:ankyrin repeat protein
MAKSLLESPDAALYYAAAYEQFDQLIPPLVKQGAQKAEVIFDKKAGNQGKVNFPECMEATIQNIVNWKGVLPDTAIEGLKAFKKDFPRVDPLDSRRRNAWATLVSNLQEFGVTYSEKKKILGKEFQYNMHPTVDNLLKVCEYLLYPGNKDYAELKTKSAQLDFLTQYLSQGDRKLTWVVPGHKKPSDIDSVETDVNIEFSLDGKPAFKFHLTSQHAEPSSLLKEKKWTHELYPHLEKLALSRAGKGPISRYDQEVLIGYSTDEQKEALAQKYLDQGDLKNAYRFLLSRSDLSGVDGRLSLIHKIISQKIESFYPIALKTIQNLPQEDPHVQFGLANALIQFKKPSPDSEVASALKVLKDKFVGVAESQETEAWEQVGWYGWTDLSKHLLKRNPNLLESKDSMGRTLLSRAALAGSLDIVKYLIKKGADKNHQADTKDTPLNYAAHNGKTEVVKYLLQVGAEINQADEDGWTPLKSAAVEGHLEVVKALIKAGAKLDEPNSDGWTPLHSAAGQGHVEVVKALIKAGAKLDEPNNDGWTPLNHAAGEGHVEVVKALIKAGANVDTPIKNGLTPLNNAAEEGHLEVVKVLIEHDAEIGQPDEDGWTPLNHAANKGHAEVVKALIKAGANIETPTKEGWTPLNNAADEGHVEVVKELIKAEANIDTPNKQGWTPLNHAAGKGHVEVVKALIKAGAKLDTPNKQGWTPLNNAADEGHLEVVKELIKAEANIGERNNFRRTPLSSAAGKGHVEVVKELIEHSAKRHTPTPLSSATVDGHVAKELITAGPYIDWPDYDGWTPLNSAANKGHVEVVRALIKAGAKLDEPNNFGWTPLHSAADEGRLEVVKALIKAGAKIDQKNNDGWAPLNTAASNGHVEVVRALIKAGAKLDEPNGFGWTPLNSAANKGHLEVVRNLVDAGADIDKPDRGGFTPMAKAVDSQRLEVVQYLMSKRANPLAAATKSILELAKNPSAQSNRENQDKILEAIKKYMLEYKH